MLKKLIKYELKKTWKIPALICGIIIVIGLLQGFFRITGLLKLNESGAGDIISSISFLLMMLMSVYLPIRYYKSLYSSEGYFSFTLPASIAEVVSSKMIVGAIWIIAVMASPFITLPLSSAFNSSAPGSEALSSDDICLTIAFIFFILMFSLSNLWISYFSVTVGKSWQKHKLAGTLLCYFCTWLVVGLIALILTGSMEGFLYRIGGNNDGTVTELQRSITLAMDGIGGIILCFILTRASIAVTEDTLNLE